MHAYEYSIRCNCLKKLSLVNELAGINLDLKEFVCKMFMLVVALVWSLLPYYGLKNILT